MRMFVKSLIEDFKAYRRGEKRVAPRGTRGRIYAPTEGKSEVGTTFRAKADPVATLIMKITRTDGTVERVTVPAKVKFNG